VNDIGQPFITSHALIVIRGNAHDRGTCVVPVCHALLNFKSTDTIFLAGSPPFLAPPKYLSWCSRMKLDGQNSPCRPLSMPSGSSSSPSLYPSKRVQGNQRGSRGCTDMIQRIRQTPTGQRPSIGFDRSWNQGLYYCYQLCIRWRRPLFFAHQAEEGVKTQTHGSNSGSEANVNGP
jgi:hypothetical protein